MYNITRISYRNIHKPVHIFFYIQKYIAKINKVLENLKGGV